MMERGLGMKVYIREHLKTILVITATLLFSGLIVASPVIIAKMLPIISEELSIVSVDIEQNIYEYTGEEIKPEINEIVFKDFENNRIIKLADEFVIESYVDNVEIGYASIEVSASGYQGTIVIEDAFLIRPAKTKGLQIVAATREAIDLSWEQTAGADGYCVFKSVDGGNNFSLLAESTSSSYQDVDIHSNAVYDYYICAYADSNNQIMLGDGSDTVKQYTPLDTPVISAVKNVSYNTLRVEWAVISGAVGYQVYRSTAQDGEYTCLAEIADGNTVSFDDTTVECGKTYYYYIKACQKTETSTIYGDASAVVSGRTTPHRVSLSGSTTQSNTKVSLSWKKVSGAQGYEVYKANKLVKTIESADTLSWSESGLSGEADITYKVRAYCVVNGEKIYGSYSGGYEKDVTINYSYGSVSSELSALTQYVGYQYVYGGTTTKGWDCSGFVKYVFSKHFGVSLPRTAAQQCGRGTTVSKNNRSAWKPGDLLFYKQDGRVSHVAIYLGNGQMIHALSSKYDTLIQGVDYYERWDSKTSLYCVKRIFN